MNVQPSLKVFGGVKKLYMQNSLTVGEETFFTVVKEAYNGKNFKDGKFHQNFPGCFYILVDSSF